MTTILAVQKDDDVILGWDSRMLRGNEKHSLVTPKVWAQNGVVYGVAGTSRAMDLLASLDFPDYDGTDPRLWLINKWRPVLWAAFQPEKAMWNDEEDGTNFAVLAVVGGQVFLLDTLLSPVQQSEGFYGIGSGADYALGVLQAGGTVMQALEAAARLDQGTGGDLTAKSARAILDEAAAFDGKYVVTVARKDQPHKAWSFDLDYNKIGELPEDLGLAPLTPWALLGWAILHSLKLDAAYISRKVAGDPNVPAGDREYQEKSVSFDS